MKNVLKKISFILVFAISYFGNSVLQNTASGLFAQNPVLYGTTTFGGNNYPTKLGGVLFKINADGINYSKLIDFGTPTTGDTPVNGGITVDGTTIYGANSGGGDNNRGIIYKINTDGTNYVKIYDNNPPTLSTTNGNFTVIGNALYATIFGGGIGNRGGIMRVNTDGTGYTELYRFVDLDGANPLGSLLFHNGVFYGTTSAGGTNNLGTIFKINIDGTGFTKLLDFDGLNNGSKPYRSLIAEGNTLYGTTEKGGAYDVGTIFKINTDGTNYTKLLDFNGINNGKEPFGTLLLVGNKLFGTVSANFTTSPLRGNDNAGLLFSIKTDGTNYIIFKEFSGIGGVDGVSPQGTLSLWGSTLFGTTTEGGVANNGTLFKIDVNGSGFTKIKDFMGGADGLYPTENLLFAEPQPPAILTFSASLNPFASCAGAIPVEQTYELMGRNLTNNIVINAPTDFEISLTSGTGFSNTLTLTQTGGNVPLTTIFVRRLAAAPIGASGTITHTSTGAVSRNIPIPAGITAALPTLTGITINQISTIATSFAINYTNTTDTPNQYSLATVSPNPLPGFVAITNATLTGTSINVTIPASVAGTYNFELTIRNSVTGCVSAIIPFTLTVVAIVPPTLTTPTHTLVNPYSAVLGGNVTAGTGLSEIGIVWSATQTNPTVADNKVVASGINSLGTFAIFVQLLPPATTINYRAYAINEHGISYSTTANFTTGAALSGLFSNGQNAEFVIGQPNFTTGTSGVTSQKMNIPVTVAIDYINNKMYVGESSNNRILRFTYPITGNNPTAELVLGQLNFTTGTANNGGLSQSSLSSPSYIFVDNTGRLWVSDANNNRVLWFNNAHSIASNKPNADGVLGQVNFTTSISARTQNGMNFPTALTIDNLGNLYVADNNNNRVLRFDKAALKINGSNADGVLGQANFTDNSFITSANTMRQPMGLATQGTTLWVSDQLYNRILRFDNAANKANGAAADGVLGQANFTSSSINRGGSPAANTLRSNTGLITDFTGRLWVADRFNNRFLGYNNAQSKANGADADLVLGQPDFTTVSTATTQNRVNLPLGVFYDIVNDKLLAVDGLNHRVLQFATLPTSPTIILSNTTLNAFVSCVSTVSAEQNYTVFGINLTNNIVITAPTGFEISLTTGTGFTNMLTLTPTSGTVATTTIFVRQSATASNGAGGNITHVSTGATQVDRSIPASTVTSSPNLTGLNVANVGTVATSFTIAYTGTVGSPTQYSITTAAPNPLPSFVSVTNATFTASPLMVSLPTNLVAGIYNFVLNVGNGGCSTNIPFTLTIVGNTSNAANRRLNALNFNGTNQFVTTPDNDNGLSAYTIETWLYWTPNTPNDVQFICAKDNEQMEIHLGGIGNNGVRFIPSAGVYIDALGAIPTNQWVHLAVTYNPAASNGKIYVNGREVASRTTSLGSNINTATLFNIGRRSNNSFLLNGVLDEFRIWKVARTQQEIRENMHLTLPNGATNLNNYYQFNEATSQSTTIDGVGGFAGTVNGATWVTSGANVSAGTSFTINNPATGIDQNFTGTNLVLNFGNSIGTGEVVVSRLEENPTGTQLTGTTVFPAHYWVVNNFGTNQTGLNITAKVTLGAGQISVAQQTTPSQIKLNQRTINSGGAWNTPIDATSATSSTGEVVFTNNSAMLEFVISTPPAEINVKGNANNIIAGSLTANIANHTSFGTVDIGSSFARTYTIENLGGATLNISSITSNNAKFVVSNVPTTVVANGSATFTVTYTPTVAGADNATITINNNDSDEGTYTFVIQGNLNNALDFDGVNDYVTIPHQADLEATNNFTVEAWVKPNAKSTINTILSKGNSGGATNGWKLFINNFNTSDGAILFETNSHSTRTNVGAITVGTWQHIAVVVNAGVPKIYLNGVEQPLVEAAFIVANSGLPLRIGSFVNNVFFFNGSMDEVRIWNVARTCTQINAVKDRELLGNEANLVAYYNFNQGVAGGTNTGVNTLTDLASSVGGDNVGTLTNFALTGMTSNWLDGSGTNVMGITPIVPNAINIKGNNVNITAGDVTPSTTDHTDFGFVNINTPFARTYTIENTGGTVLNINNITSSNTKFVVSNVPSMIAAGSSATFTVTYTTNTTGIDNATITVLHNACGGNYNFAVTGQGASVSIGSFSPTGTGTGVDATITLTGTGFTGTTAVSIGGQPARSFCVVNATTLKAVTNDNITNGDIVITNGGTATLNGFVAAIVPNGTITGTSFVTVGGFTVLRVNITPASPTQWRQALRYREVGASTWNNLTIDPALTSVDIQGVTANKAYEIYLQTISTAGQWSNRSAITTSANSGTATFCSPTVAATAGISGTMVTFNWTAQTNATRYIVRYWEVAPPQGTCAAEQVAGSNKTVYVDNGTANNVVVGSLKPNTSYAYDVQVYCGSTTVTNRSNVITFTTGAGIVCAVPSIVNFVQTTLDGYAALNVTWSGATGVTTGSPKYQLRYKTTAGTSWSYWNTDATSYTMTGLEPNTQYDFQIAVFCEGAVGGEWSSLYTPMTGAAPNSCPLVTLGTSTPFSLAGGIVGANLVWTGIAPTVGRRFFLGYTKDGESFTVWRWIDTNGVTVRSDLDYPNLMPSSNYSYILQTYCNLWNFAGYAIGNPGAFTTGAVTGADKNTDSSVATNQNATNELVIYPNPSEGEVTIQTLQGFGNLARLELSVIDVLGREVYSQSFNGSVSVKLDGKSLCSGVYVAKVTENGKVMTKKFVIQ